MRAHLRPFLIGLVGAVVGVVTLIVIYTLVIDHLRMNAVWELEQRRATAAQQVQPQGK